MDDETAKPGPSHIAYQVRQGPEGQSYFNRVGSAFAHKDGQGFNVVMDAVPVDGRLTLRTAKERLDRAKDGKAAPAERGSDEQER